MFFHLFSNIFYVFSLCFIIFFVAFIVFDYFSLFFLLFVIIFPCFFHCFFHCFSLIRLKNTKTGMIEYVRAPGVTWLQIIYLEAFHCVEMLVCWFSKYVNIYIYYIEMDIQIHWQPDNLSENTVVAVMGQDMQPGRLSCKRGLCSKTRGGMALLGFHPNSIIIYIYVYFFNIICINDRLNILSFNYF